MTHSSRELDDLVRWAGAVRVRDHPELAWAIRAGVRDGVLVRMLPGVVAAADRRLDPDVRIVAATLWRPSGVLLGRAAARASFDREMRVDVVELAGDRGVASREVRVVESRVNPDFVRHLGMLTFTDASLTVVDLLRVGDRGPLYDALRRRVVTLGSLRHALAANPRRRGNDLARREIWDARQNPWSDGEAELHQFLRGFGITGWRGNARLVVDTAVFFADALFGRERLILELDGLGHHTAVADREYDYRRRAALLGAGYRVMGLTLGMIRGEPELTAARISASRAIVAAKSPARSSRSAGPSAGSWQSLLGLRLGTADQEYPRLGQPHCADAASRAAQAGGT